METVSPTTDNPEHGTTVQPTHAVVETEPSPMYISLSQAAKIWGKHKGTISKHVKDGKLQWHDRPGGERKLFAPQVADLYGAPPSTVSATVGNAGYGAVAQPVSNPGNPSEIIALTAALNAKDDLIKVLQSQIEREREVAEQWRKEYTVIKEQVLALPAPKPAEEPKKKGLWPFRRKE